jgi:NAD(P)-dependent dehydrogenase (short-subunit alcohol dehydrogenase family)
MNQIDLKGRVAVVTGGAQGIGYATAQRCCAVGRRRGAVGHRRRAAAQARASLSALGRVEGQVWS